MVLVTEDVGQHGELVAFLDQTHGDASHRGLDRYTGVHQRQGGAAYGSHRAGAVGFGDFRHHADGVGEVGLGRQHGGDATAGQAAVADLATTRAAHAAALADRERREVVVQHEGVLALAFQGVEQLGVAGGAEGGDHQGLGLAAGEQRRAVGLAQHADFDLQRAHGAGVAAVDARLAVDDVLAHGAVFEQAEHVLDLAGRELAFAFTGELADHLIAQGVESGIALLLDGDGVGVGDRLAELGLDGVDQRGVGGRRLPVPARLAGFGGEFLDGADGALELLVGEQHGAQHLVFGQLFGFRLDHQHGVFGTGHDHVQARALQLLVGRVEDVAHFVVVTDTGGADRAVKRDAGYGQRGGGADHRGDVRIGLLVGGNDGADNLHFVHEALREKRADRAVDQARGQGFLLARTAFTLEEATRDATGGVGLLLVVHGQREEALARIGLLGTDHGDQDGHAIHVDQHGAGGLTGNAPGLEGDGRLTELELLDNRIHGVFLLCVALGKSRKRWESDPDHSAGHVRKASPRQPFVHDLGKPKAGSPKPKERAAPALTTSNFQLPASRELRLSDAGPDARSGRCNEWCPYPSGSPAACGAG